MSGDAHIDFIIAAYGVTVIALLSTVVVLLLDSRAQQRLLARFSDRRRDDA